MIDMSAPILWIVPAGCCVIRFLPSIVSPTIAVTATTAAVVIAQVRAWRLLGVLDNPTDAHDSIRDLEQQRGRKQLRQSSSHL